VVSAGSYILSALALAAVGLSLGFSAFTLRQRLLPAWEGAPARLVEAVTAIALLIWLGELLGTVGLFYAWALIIASLLLAAGSAAWPRVLSQGEGGTAGSPRAVLDPPPPTPPTAEPAPVDESKPEAPAEAAPAEEPEPEPSAEDDPSAGGADGVSSPAACEDEGASSATGPAVAASAPSAGVSSTPSGCSEVSSFFGSSVIYLSVFIGFGCWAACG